MRQKDDEVEVVLDRLACPVLGDGYGGQVDGVDSQQAEQEDHQAEEAPQTRAQRREERLVSVGLVDIGRFLSKDIPACLSSRSSAALRQPLPSLLYVG